MPSLPNCAAPQGSRKGKDRAMGELQFIARPVDLIFGPNSELRAVVEAYADADAAAGIL